MTQSVNNIQSCNFTRTVLMLLVVLCHSVAFFGGPWFKVLALDEPSRVLGLLSSWLGTFHVQGFTLVSGYVYYYLSEEKGKYPTVSSLLSKKIQRLLIPYVMVSTLWVIPIGNLFFHYSIRDVIVKYALGTAPSQLWFLLMLFNIFLISALYKNIVNTKLRLIFAVLFLVVGNVLSLGIPNIFQIFTAMRYLIFFELGCYIRQHYSDISSRRMGCIGVGFLLLNVSLFFIARSISVDGFMMQTLHLGVNVLCQLTGALMAFFILSCFSSNINWKNKVFDSLSNASFAIYLFHQQFIYILLSCFLKYCNPICMSLICFIVSTLLAWGFSVLLRRFRFTRFIVGIR